MITLQKKIATATAHTQRALHGAHSTKGWSGKKYTRAHHRDFLFPVTKIHTEFFTFLRPSPPIISRDLPASRSLLRARFDTCKQASAISRWAPSLSEVVCGEHGIGGDGEYCGDNDAQLDRINVL
jgi:hypothetical protein